MTATGVDSNTRSASPWGYRQLIGTFAQRDLKARFKGTALGWTWSLFVPLATVLTYTLVFATIFRAQPPDFGNGREGVFAVWFICGLVPWMYFSGTISTGMPSLLASGPLLQKIYIPSFVPVLGAGAAVLTQSLIEFGLVLVVLALFLNISWTWLLVPAWLAIFVVFSSSIAYVLAVANVFFRDLVQIVAVGLQLLFFATPIIYTFEQIPSTAGPIPLSAVIMANPITDFVVGFRFLLYDLQPIPWNIAAYAATWTAATVVLARAVYLWRGRDAGEEI